MGKYLRKVPEKPAFMRIILFRQQPNIIAKAEEPFENFSGLVPPALEKEIVREPKSA